MHQYYTGPDVTAHSWGRLGPGYRYGKSGNIAHTLLQAVPYTSEPPTTGEEGAGGGGGQKGKGGGTGIPGTSWLLLFTSCLIIPFLCVILFLRTSGCPDRGTATDNGIPPDIYCIKYSTPYLQKRSGLGPPVTVRNSPVVYIHRLRNQIYFSWLQLLCNARSWSAQGCTDWSPSGSHGVFKGIPMEGHPAVVIIIYIQTLAEHI